jgi:hypothetical protein
VDAEAQLQRRLQVAHRHRRVHRLLALREAVAADAGVDEVRPMLFQPDRFRVFPMANRT